MNLTSGPYTIALQVNGFRFPQCRSTFSMHDTETG